MIIASNVEKLFTNQPLFSGITIKIAKGDRVGLIGKNGVGKSTLLKILLGEVSPDSGDVSLQRGTTLGYLAQELPASTASTILGEVEAGASELCQIKDRLDMLHRGDLGDTEIAELAQLEDRFAFLDGHSLTARAEAILHGLGFKDNQFGAPITSLSGGWRMRVFLAKLLLQSPDILLLDEPTNHLDVEALEWFERYLEQFSGGLLVISHDRYFLNRAVNKIAVMSKHNLVSYAGNYDHYILQRDAALALQAKQAKVQDRKRKEVESFIERFRAKATKARQVQSRITMLEKMDEVLAPDEEVRFAFALPPGSRTSKIVAELSNLSFAYTEKPVIAELSLRIENGERIALLGPNGAGKSTLIKLLCSRLTPSQGELRLGSNVRPYYYAQHLAEEFPLEDTIFETLWERFPELPPTRIRALLGHFGFSDDSVFKTFSVLSGGEKARVALTQMFLSQPNFLLLDEPTNHLDMDGREALEAALRDYGGTICLISHDRAFIRALATKVAFLADGKAELYLGGYDYYLEKRRQEVEPGIVVATAPRPFDDKRDKKREEAEDRNRRYKLRQALEKKIAVVEQKIIDAETRIAAIDEALSDASTYQQREQAKSLGNEKLEIQQRLEALNAEWEELGEELLAIDAA